MAAKRITMKDVPQAAIRFIVGNMHVSTTDEEVAAAINKRTVGWPDRARKLALEYALRVHKDNQRLYSDVMGGRIGRGRAEPKKRRIIPSRYVEPKPPKPPTQADRDLEIEREYEGRRERWAEARFAGMAPEDAYEHAFRPRRRGRAGGDSCGCAEGVMKPPTKASLKIAKRMATREADTERLRLAVEKHAVEPYLKPGMKIGPFTITHVGSHTVQYKTRDGWTGSIGVSFVSPTGKPTKAWAAAMREAGYGEEVEPYVRKSGGYAGEASVSLSMLRDTRKGRSAGNTSGDFIVDRLTIRETPWGLEYGDRIKVVDGDYLPVGFLSFKTLVFTPAEGADPRLAAEGYRHAAILEKHRGEPYNFIRYPGHPKEVILGRSGGYAGEARASSSACGKRPGRS